MKLGKLQMRIMQRLWSEGELSARQLTGQLSQDQEVAHSTVQTILRKLMDKGAVTYRQDGRTFLYQAAVAENIATQGVVRDFLSRIFQGSPGDLAAYLVENESLSDEEITQLKKLISDKNKKAR